MIRLIAWAMDQPLPPNHRFVLVVLSDCCGPEATCHPKIRYIRRKTGLSDRTIQRCLRDMEAAKVVVSFQDDTKRQAWRVNHDLALTVPMEEMRGKGAKKRLTAEAVEAFEARCYWCEKQGTEKDGPDGQPWTIDLLSAGKDGGKHSAENIALACQRCFGERRQKPQLEFESVLAKPSPKRKARGDTGTPGGCHGDTGGVTQGHRGGVSLSPPSQPSVQPSVQPKSELLPADGDQLPPPLNTPDIQQWWETWQANLIQKKKKLTPIARRLQIKKLLSWGPERALAALEHCATNNYTGLFEPTGPGRSAAPARVKKAITKDSAW